MVSQFKRVFRIVSRICIGILLFVAVVLFATGAILMIPSVQTRCAQKAAGILSKELQTEIHIEKLRVNWNLDIVLQDFMIKDRHGEPMLGMDKLKVHLPVYHRRSRTLVFHRMKAERLLVYIAKYTGEPHPNIYFLADYFRSDNPKKGMRLLFKHSRLKDSRFEFFYESKWEADQDGLWNYRDIRLNDIQAAIKTLDINGKDIILDIKNLQLKEHSGFEMTHYQGNVLINDHKIYCENTRFECGNGTRTDVDFRFDFDHFSSFSDFYDSVYFRCSLRPSVIAMEDLKYFVPAFQSMDNRKYRLQGDVSDCLSELRIEDFRLSLNDSAYLSGNVYTKGLPDAENTIWNVRLDEACFPLAYLEGYGLPKGKKLHFPSCLKNMVCSSADGEFLGSFQDFEAAVRMRTNYGDVQAEGHYSGNYTLDFAADNLLLTQLLGKNPLRKMALQGHVSGEGKNIEEYRADIHELLIHENTINDLHINGDKEDERLTFHLSSRDTLLKAEVKGFSDMSDDGRNLYYANMDVEYADLSALCLFRPDSAVSVSMHGDVQMKGKNWNDMEGEISLKDAVYSQNGRNFPLRHWVANVQQATNAQGEVNIRLFSDVMMAECRGNIPYPEIPARIRQEVSCYLPHALSVQYSLPEGNPYWDLSLHMRKSFPLLEVLFPKFRYQGTLDLKASRIPDAAERLNLEMSSPLLLFGNTEFHQCHLEGIGNEESMDMIIHCGDVVWNHSDSLSNLQDVRLRAECHDDTVAFEIESGQDDGFSGPQVSLGGQVHFLESYADVHFQKGDLKFGKSVFAISPENRILLSEQQVRFRQCGFSSGEQSFVLDGTYSSRYPSRIQVDMHRLILSEFDVFMKPYHLSMDGMVDGNILVSGQDTSLKFSSNVEISNFVFNETSYGRLSGSADWEEHEQRIRIRAHLYPLEDATAVAALEGYYIPSEQQIDLKGNIQSFDLHMLEPYLTSFATHVEGLCSGELFYTGPVQNPRLGGFVHFEEASLGIGYILTDYHIHHQDMRLIDTGFLFENFCFTDDYGNTGSMSGVVTHERLKHFGLELDVDFDHAMVLNTQYKDNDLFFGKAFGSGSVHLHQRPQGDFVIQGNVRTENPTYISILLNRSTTVSSQNSFIVFEKPYTMETELDTMENPNKKAHITGTNLMLDVSATPDATVKVVLDPSIGGTIVGSGNGAIRMELYKNRPFEMFGTYFLTDGTVDLALGNIITRTLKVENGSALSWNGKPSEGQMDIRASYSTKTSITNLLNESSLTSSYRSIPVSTLLSLKGNLLNPEFNFNIRMDDVDESIQSMVYNALDTTDKEEMFRQAFSLMLIGRFEAEQNSGSTVNYGIGYSLSELFSHYLQKMMSALTDNVNLGFLYKPGDGGYNGDEYNVQLSTNLMENRLSIQGSLDIYGDNGFQDEQAVAGNVVGDIIVEYKITRDGSLRIKVFNMANYYDVLSSVYTDVPYYQGIGIAFSKDFNTLKDLFRRKKKDAQKNTGRE